MMILTPLICGSPFSPCHTSDQMRPLTLYKLIPYTDNETSYDLTFFSHQYYVNIKDTYSFNGVKVLLVTTWPMYAQMQTVACSEWQIICKGHTQCIGTWHKCRTCERSLLTSK
jgi:hypothetical protein